MKELTLGKLSARIEKGNKAFEAMTKAQKRVEIAKDTILRVNMKQFVANRGAILSDIKGSALDPNIKAVLNSNKSFTCQVCAKGGLLMAYIGRVNKVQFSSILGALGNGNEADSLAHVKLSEIFTLKQLALIEVAFEGVQYLTHMSESESNLNVTPTIVLNKVQFHRAVAFYQRKGGDFYAYRGESVDNRLIKICENIIRNKGTFKL